jgi:hypothetical protein
MSETDMKPRIPAFVIGLLVPIIYSNVGHILGIWDSAWLFLLLVALYIAAGAYIWRGTFKRSAGAFLVILLLVPVAVIIDVNIDWFIRKFDRNLFPFEIVFLWVVAPVFLLIGMGAKKLLHSSKPLEPTR